MLCRVYHYTLYSVFIVGKYKEELSLGVKHLVKNKTVIVFGIAEM